MLIKTPCEIGDTVIMNNTKYTCCGFIIGATGANVNLFDEKHKLYQPSFEQVEKNWSDIFQAKWKLISHSIGEGLKLECPACGYERTIKIGPSVPPRHCERCGANLGGRIGD